MGLRHCNTKLVGCSLLSHACVGASGQPSRAACLCILRRYSATLLSPPVQVLDRPAFACSMLEKLIWICAFMLVGARHGGCTVGEVESQASCLERASC